MNTNKHLPVRNECGFNGCDYKCTTSNSLRAHIQATSHMHVIMMNVIINALWKYMRLHTQVGSIMKVSLDATINALPCLDILKPIDTIATSQANYQQSTTNNQQLSTIFMDCIVYLFRFPVV